MGTGEQLLEYAPGYGKGVVTSSPRLNMELIGTLLSRSLVSAPLSVLTRSCIPLPSYQSVSSSLSFVLLAILFAYRQDHYHPLKRPTC